MFGALIFTNIHNLDFSEIRHNVMRIPEVLNRIREAQELWDSQSERDFSLANFIAADDAAFLGNIRLKSLAAAVVQMGLYDRYRRLHPEPKLVLGLSNGDSPLNVAVGQQSFAQMVSNSRAMGRSFPALAGLSQTPVLAGMSLSEYSLFEHQEGDYRPLISGHLDLKRVMSQAVPTEAPRKMVTIGHADAQLESLAKELRVELVDSIVLDPVLSWFWQESRATAQAVVQ